MISTASSSGGGRPPLSPAASFFPALLALSRRQQDHLTGRAAHAEGVDPTSFFLPPAPGGFVEGILRWFYRQGHERRARAQECFFIQYSFLLALSAAPHNSF